MSSQNRPSYQRPTISSSQYVTPVKRTPGNVTPVKRTPGNVTPGKRPTGNVPLLKVLSPVRSPYHRRAQETVKQNIRDNPLFGNDGSDAGEGVSGRLVGETNSLKTAKSSKENGETKGCSTPGKISRAHAAQFSTPPKSLVKRKLLSESNKKVCTPLGSSTPRRGEESRLPLPSGNLASERQYGDQEGLRRNAEIMSTEPSIVEFDEQQSAVDFMIRSPEPSINESDERQAPVDVRRFRRSSVEALQKRIQTFLQTRTLIMTPVLPEETNQCVLETSMLFDGFSGGGPETRYEDGIAPEPVIPPDSSHPGSFRTRMTRILSPSAAEVEGGEGFANDPSPAPVLESVNSPKVAEAQEEEGLADDSSPAPVIESTTFPMVVEVQGIKEDQSPVSIMEQSITSNCYDPETTFISAENNIIDAYAVQTASSSETLEAGSNCLPGKYAAQATPSSICAEQFSRLCISSKETPSQPAVDRKLFLSREKVSKPLAESNSFRSPEVSKLGRFTTIVPIVHKKGTEKEEVKLTPVRRSNRIRNKLQPNCNTTPSRFVFSP
ncbi:hypothetical protein R1flu_002410 [Riccia fluitans]|uniref:Uncharacterized protein n=1 Tax=Riccia fluitans TaxID=41844 RepID=A0ABD1Y6J7_9MARC